MSNKSQNELMQEFGGRGEKLASENINHPDEKIFAKLKGSFGEGLIVTNRAVYILKWGMMVGNIFGGRCNAFSLKNISSLEIKKGLLTGTFEVLTPATQNANKSFWGTKNDSALKSDNVVTFQRNKFDSFQKATNVGREMINNAHSQTQSANNVTTDYSELEKLSELKDKGIITQEEFDMKKKKILEN